jgi:hypothetical protein
MNTLFDGLLNIEETTLTAYFYYPQRKILYAFIYKFYYDMSVWVAAKVKADATSQRHRCACMICVAF